MSEPERPTNGALRDFEASYNAEAPPPWDIGRPQPAFVAVADRGGLRGRVLDVGCGTGEHALLAAARGFEAVGVDLAPTAVAAARRKASERGLDVRFIEGDALALGALGETFDTVLDCGVFHVFSDDDRGRFVVSLAAALSPGGRYYMLCFSDRQPGDWGPRRIREDEIRMSFADSWSIESIVPATLELTLHPDGAQAWLSTIVRR